MDKKDSGRILRLLAGSLFDQASLCWYFAFFVEILSGLIIIIGDIIDFSSKTLLILSIVSISLLVISYILKLIFDQKYDSAETMRRQSVLSEGANWSIDQIQLDSWYQEAGIEMVEKILNTADQDYYSSKLDFGANRIAEMTSESIFYTKYIYKKIKRILFAVFIISSIVFIYISLCFLIIRNPQLETTWFKVILSIVSMVISIDLLGWIIRLGRITKEFEQIEYSLLNLNQSSGSNLPEVFREIMEYNCQLVKGIPIPKFIFKKYHSEISRLWEIRESNHQSNLTPQ